MADATYVNESVYEKQGANEIVIANGGTLTVENGGEITVETGGLSTIESGGSLDVESGGGIDIQSGADITVESGGSIEVDSGGQIDLANGATFEFYSTDEEFTSAQMAATCRGSKYLYITNYSTGATVLSDAGGSSPPILDSTYGNYIISASGGMTNGSARLHSGLTGQKIFIGFANSMNGSTCSLTVYTSIGGLAGVKIFGSDGTELSCIRIGASVASWGGFFLDCIQDGSWVVSGSVAPAICVEEPAQ